jgi:hypothetical protein
VGKVAFISLFCPSNSDYSEEELALQIREKLESSSLLSGWVLDKVTVLDEDTSRTGPTPIRYRKKFAVA